MSQPYDVIILGTGPAGLQAAIHAARRKVSVLVLGKRHKSSAYGAHIENYCCTDGLSGEQMLSEGQAKAEAAGGVFLPEDVTAVAREGNRFLVTTESGKTFDAAALVLAMGINRNRLGIPGEKELLGRGVSYCVECDAGFFRGEAVAVVGGESAAVTGALTLLFYAREIHLVCRALEVAEGLARQVRESGVVIHEGVWPREIPGKDAVEALVLDDGTRLPVAGVFIELGARGAVGLAGSLGVTLDPEKGEFIVVDRNQATNVPGLYAAGDITGLPWQMAKAVGEGCVAGLEAAAFARKP